MHDDRIKIRLPNARQKLQSLFPEDNRGDIRIEFGPKSFKLQKAFLRLESTYFKKSFTSNQVVLTIHQPFKVPYFTNIMKCFYGFTIEISRSEILEYYPIVKFLQVESLVKLLREDMIHKADNYDVFVLMQLAHQYDEQELFETCLIHLQKEQFEQLRYAKLELLRCTTDLFKMVVKTHNRMKVEKHRGISFMEIDQLIKEFSDEKKFNQGQYQELKFELLDKNSLTSQEYKEIFLDDNKRKKTNEYSSMIRVDSEPRGHGREQPFLNSRLTESLITPALIGPNNPLNQHHNQHHNQHNQHHNQNSQHQNHYQNGSPHPGQVQKMNDELKLEMEHTWEKKKNEELKAENQILFREMEEMKTITAKNKKNFDELKEIVQKMQRQLEDKDKYDKEQSNTIKKLTKLCDEFKKELNEKGEVIRRLEEKMTRLEKQPDKIPEKRISGVMAQGSKYLPIDDENEESRTIQSQIVPGHLLKEIAMPAAEALSAPPNNRFKKNKVNAPVVAVKEQSSEQEEQDEESIEEMYTSRLTFDFQPRGCPKKFLPNLANFMTSDGFQKKMLNLIYRRNIHNKQTRGSPSDLFGRDSLLVLICTRMNQVIGGFTSIQINKGSKDYITDDYAFMFNLTKNQKFKIKKNVEGEAIFIAADYLLCFSNDLMISIDPIKHASRSDWSCAYEGGYEKRSTKWLTGEEGEFSIKEIQIYEVKEEAMIMDL